MSFTRLEETFICEHCTQETKGNGYTNHCPYCLYSKHVDITPGDRAASCGGLMSPTEVLVLRHGWVLVHTCIVCRYQKKNKISPADNIEMLLRIAQDRARDVRGK
jgi:RNHCP domain